MIKAEITDLANTSKFIGNMSFNLHKTEETIILINLYVSNQYNPLAKIKWNSVINNKYILDIIHMLSQCDHVFIIILMLLVSIMYSDVCTLTYPLWSPIQSWFLNPTCPM